MVIGEGPGADEDESGRPFVGKAGQLLDKMLASIGLSRTTNCFIANIVKCRPPQNREPTPDESGACIRYLSAQIELVKPAMILAVGRTAAQNLLGTSDGINKLRGRFFDFSGIPLLPTFHPSALLRDETLKRPAWEDLKLFRAELDRITGTQA
jgi:DNA polymerase